MEDNVKSFLDKIQELKDKKSKEALLAKLVAELGPDAVQSAIAK